MSQTYEAWKNNPCLCTIILIVFLIVRLKPPNHTYDIIVLSNIYIIYTHIYIIYCSIYIYVYYINY